MELNLWVIKILLFHTKVCLKGMDLMINESKAMKELHDIRAKHSELYEGMSNDEYLKFVKGKASIMKIKIENIRNSHKVK